MFSFSIKKNNYHLIFVLSLILFLICQILKAGYSPDDSYIYLQYARNIASCNGISFNSGEPGYGITSPLWAIILTISYFLNIDGFWFAKVLDLVSALASIYIYYKLSGKILSYKLKDEYLRSNLQIISASIFTINIWFIRWSFTGMETSFAVLCVLSIFYFYINDSYISSFILLGLFYLIRPESIILFIVLFIFLIINKTSFKKVVLYSSLYIIIVIAFLIFSKLYFGTFVPNTAIGKTSFNFGFITYYLQLKRIISTIAFSNIIEIILSVYVLIYYFWMKKLEKVDLLILSWFTGLILLYLITDSDIISRYLMIIIPFITIYSVQYFAVLKNRKLLKAVLVFIIILLQSQFLFFYYVKPHTDNFTKGINDCYIYIGNWLSNNTYKDSRIVLNDVGTMGYYSNRYVIDAGALINHDLYLNKELMATPLVEREKTTNVLRFTHADYLVQRDSLPDPFKDKKLNNYSLQFLFFKEFPGLGISDPKPKFYSIYRIVPKN